MTSRKRLVALCALLLLVGCGGPAAVGDDAGGGDGAPSDATAGGDTGTPSFGGDAGPIDAGPTSDAGSCPAAATMVYVTGNSGELWSFWPPTFTFKKIGLLSCTNFPWFMTVDRTGTAWVVSAGKIYKTSTKDATCSALPTWTPQTGFDMFSVSFVGVSSPDDTLYLLGSTQLGALDIVTGTFKVVGTPAVAATLGDMTSNGDGTLYFLQANVSPHPLYEIDPSNAAIKNKYSVSAGPNGVTTQALAYFGGRFYVFESNVVYEYDPVTKAIKKLGNAPLSVTGAGQSTCVPQVPTDAGPPVN